HHAAGLLARARRAVRAERTGLRPPHRRVRLGEAPLPGHQPGERSASRRLRLGPADQQRARPLVMVQRPAARPPPGPARDQLMPPLPPPRLTWAMIRFRAGLARLHRAAPPEIRILEGLFGLFDNRALGLL